MIWHPLIIRFQKTNPSIRYSFYHICQQTYIFKCITIYTMNNPFLCSNLFTKLRLKLNAVLIINYNMDNIFTEILPVDDLLIFFQQRLIALIEQYDMKYIL